MKEVAFYLDGHPVHIWKPKNVAHGDLSSDIAFVLAKLYGGKPLDWAEKLLKAHDKKSN